MMNDGAADSPGEVVETAERHEDPGVFRAIDLAPSPWWVAGSPYWSAPSAASVSAGKMRSSSAAAPWTSRRKRRNTCSSRDVPSCGEKSGTWSASRKISWISANRMACSSASARRRPVCASRWRAWPVPRQHLHRTAVALAEVRMHLPARLIGRAGGPPRDRPLGELLQSPAPSCRPWRRDTGRCVSGKAAGLRSRLAPRPPPGSHGRVTNGI